MMEKILIIDDDRKLQALLRDYLSEFSYEIRSLESGDEALQMVRTYNPGIVILDIMLPGKDGFEILKELRTESRVPVIMLTAKGEDADRIIGLELGADDYLPKPFNPRELLARVKAILRRSDPDQREAGRSTVIESGGLTLHTTRHTLTIEGSEEELSSTEYRILEILMRNPNKILSRDEIMNHVIGRDHIAFDRSIDVHISRIRSRLENHPEHKKRIKTIWGTGYMFVDES